MTGICFQYRLAAALVSKLSAQVERGSLSKMPGIVSAAFDSGYRVHACVDYGYMPLVRIPRQNPDTFEGLLTSCHATISRKAKSTRNEAGSGIVKAPST